MPFIITDPCIETKDTACVDVCPVDCIHPRKDEPEFAQTIMLYIHPEECIDCGACVPACPVAAIAPRLSTTSTPSTRIGAAGSRGDSWKRSTRGARSMASGPLP